MSDPEKPAEEEVKEEAEITSADKKVPEYERPLMIVSAICGAGPLALPLVWRHPRINWFWKVMITIGVAALTWGCIWVTKILIEIMWEQWQLLLETRARLKGT